jgi:hypothetical protein
VEGIQGAGSERKCVIYHQTLHCLTKEKKITDKMERINDNKGVGTSYDTKSIKLIGNHVWIQNKFRLKFVEYVISDETTTQ